MGGVEKEKEEEYPKNERDWMKNRESGTEKNFLKTSK